MDELASISGSKFGAVSGYGYSRIGQFVAYRIWETTHDREPEDEELLTLVENEIKVGGHRLQIIDAQFLVQGSVNFTAV
jgi:hypothetical protein